MQKVVDHALVEHEGWFVSYDGIDGINFKPRFDDTLQLRQYEVKTTTVNELDPIKNNLDMEELTKFLGDFDHTYMDRTRPKGPDYLIIDNFAEAFGLEKADLMGARSEAEDLKEVVCNNLVAEAYARCDYLV